MKQVFTESKKQLLATLTLSLILALFLLPIVVTAETPEEKGLAIVDEMDRRGQGFQDSTADIVMTLKNKQGQESVRELRSKTLEVVDDGDKSLTIFDTPKDVKGTAFLSFSHKTGDDDQWLYLPALKRVKRISSRNKTGSFMGSEFSYEDMSSLVVEKYTYKWLHDEEYEGMDCFVVEFYPVDKKNSGYKRQVAWIDKAEYRVWKVEYYDRKDSHLKTMTASGFQLYADKYWMPDETLMVNHQNGKSTHLQISNYQFGVGLDEGDFNKNALKRAK